MADRRYDIVKWQDSIPVPRWLLPTLNTVDIIVDSSWGPANAYNIEGKPQDVQECLGAYEALREGLPKIKWPSDKYDVWQAVDKNLDSKYKKPDGEALSIYNALWRASYSQNIGTNLMYERLFWDSGKEPPAISLLLLVGHDLASASVKNGSVKLPTSDAKSGDMTSVFWGVTGLTAGYLFGRKK